MTDLADSRSSRLDRRKAGTRRALIAAAQWLIAEGRPAASIQEITDAADVGFGTFYNHFSAKDELYAAAVTEALEAYDSLLDAAARSIEDPAEVFAVRLRLTGRLQRVVPEMVRVFLNSGTAVLGAPHGLASRARHDIAAAQRASRFEAVNLDLAVMAVGGGLLGLMQHLESNPELDDAELTDRLAERVLRMFGIPRDEAHALCTKRLALLPEFHHANDSSPDREVTPRP